MLSSFHVRCRGQDAASKARYCRSTNVVGNAIKKIMRPRTILLFIIILSSCGDLVRFETPQPEGQKDEKSIPKRLTGVYFNVNDSTKLTITTKEIIETLETDFAGLLTELDSIERATIKTDTAYSESSENMKLDMVVKGDSIFQHLDYRDTIFSFEKNDILRKFKGYYFLNRQRSPNSWSVTKLTKTKKGIILGTVSDKADIENLRELTDTKADTVYNFRPTKKQLRQFLNDKGFKNEETFIKIE